MPKLSEAMETGKVIKWLKKEGDRGQGRRHHRRDRDRQGQRRARGVRRGRAPQDPCHPGGGRCRSARLIGVIADPAEDISALVGGGAAAAEGREPGPGGRGRAAAGRPGRARPRRPRPPRRRARPPARARPRLETHQSAPATTAAVPMAPARRRAGRARRRRPASRPRRSRGRSRSSPGSISPVHGHGPGRPHHPARRRGVRRLGAAGGGAARARGGHARRRGGPDGPGGSRTCRCRRCARPSPSACRCRRRRSRTSTSPPRSPWTRRGRCARSSTALEGQPKISVTDMVIKACALALLSTPASTPQLHRPGDPACTTAPTSASRWRSTRGSSRRSCATATPSPLARSPSSRGTWPSARAGESSERRRCPGRPSRSRTSACSTSTSSRPSSTRPRAPSSPWARSSTSRSSTTASSRVGRRMKLTISCDHRVMDGAMGARFLPDLKRLLEEPLAPLV